MVTINRLFKIWCICVPVISDYFRFTIQRILVSDILLEQSTEESTLGFDEMLKKLKESESLSSDSFKDASCVIAMSPEVEGVDLCNDIKDEPKDGVPVRDIQQDSIETNHKNSAGDFRDHDSHFTCCICESSVWFLNPLELLQHVSDSHGFHRSERNSLTLCCTFCSFELTSNNFDSSSSDTESLNQDLMLLGAHLEACRGDQVEFKTDAELEDKCGEGELDKSVKGIPQLSRLNFIEMKCFFCDNEPEFESVGELHQHMRATHVHKEECSDKSFFECPECHCHISSSRYSNKDGNTSTSFNIQRSLSGVIRHFVRKHPNSVPSFIQLHHCPHEDCEYLAGTLSEVSTHIKACHTVERIACEKCGKLVRKNTAGKHLNNCGKPKSASVEAEACLHCSECPKTFKTPAGLYSHVQKLHKGDFPFLCDHCPEKFLQRCNLIYHLFTAHGIKTSRTKVFECSSCEYSTPIRAHLKRHERTHHDVAENSVECTTCNRTYASQGKIIQSLLEISALNCSEVLLVLFRFADQAHEEGTL